MLMLMRLLQSCYKSTKWCSKYSGISRVSGVLLYSTETITTATSTPPSTTPWDTLYRRISPLGDPKVSVTAALDQWIEEGKSIKSAELREIVKKLKRFRRFTQALEVFEWMSKKNDYTSLPVDVAVHLDLISKVHGLEQAEEFFSTIPNTSIGFQAYIALLNSYAQAKSWEKAEDTMKKLRELGFANTPSSYNVMLNLYSQMGKHEKLEPLVQEMGKKGIVPDKFTFSILLNACAANSDIKGMEEILMKMDADPVVSKDFTAYTVAANGYLKAGLIKKSLAIFKKSEQLITTKTRRYSYEVLMTAYAKMRKKDEVYRIWNLCKETEKIYNTTYLCVIRSLGMLDELDEMEKVVEEWEAGRTTFDFRVPITQINAYCKNSLLAKAESVVNRIIESGIEPNANTWERLAAGYHKYIRMEKAVDALKKAILASHPGWRPASLATFAGCMKYLKEKGDVEVAEFQTLLEEHGHFSSDKFDELEKYMKNGFPDSQGLEADHDEALHEEMVGGMLLKTTMSDD